MPDYKINIPVTITKDIDKLHYILNLKEKIRLLHNSNGQNMTVDTFKQWEKEYYRPVIELIMSERDNYKLKLELDSKYTIDIKTAVSVV